MAIKLIIKDLKHIQRLEFDVPGEGAYLLTGSNGSGKTSLLTCLSRLRNSGAFQRGFRSSVHKSLDSYRGASVEYQINGSSVTYQYGEERWAPIPRNNSHLLAQCGYPEVIYIAADADRVEPKKEEFAPARVRPTGQELQDAMNSIFSTTRFSELCYINLHRGGQSKAYLIRQPRPGKTTLYFSERSFSLGELCVLKLLLSLKNIANNSLVLIDELELAVHPRAQTKLFQHLVQFAAQKHLTIIFSTHSVSLIKSTDRRNVLFLQNDSGNVNCIKGCYPTFALGQITAGEEIAPDTVIYVEDDSAKKCVDSMLQMYRRQVQMVQQPSVAVAALGGFSEILRFLDRAPQMLPPATRTTALLDRDVKDESLANFQARNDLQMLDLFRRQENAVFFLPWTPEVGLIELIRADINRHEADLKLFFEDQRIHFPAGWPAARDPAATPAQYRSHCKALLFQVSDHIARILGKPIDRVREGLFDYLVRKSPNQQDLNRLVGRVIHR